jgi:anion-transporting  ArsA/GET3 family ATPase
MQLHTEASLREYLKLNLRISVVGRIGPIANVFDFVANAAPGVKEILTVGKVCWEVPASIEGRAEWDLVIVDAAATGHVLAQLDAPRTIRELVHTGPIRHQTEWMMEILADRSLTALNIVTAPEEMPVNETIELVTRAREETVVPLGAVIVNRVLPELFTTEDEPRFAALSSDAADAVLRDHLGDDVRDILEAGRLAVALRRSRVPHLERLRAAVDLPMCYLPFLFVRDHGLRVTRMVADALGAEMGL